MKISIKKNHFNFLLTAILLHIFLSPTSIFGQKSTIKKIDEIVQAEAKYDLFSGTVLVAKEARILYAKGIGEANKEYRISNILETRFNVGSIEKCFVATLILQLCQRGKLALDDPLNQYFPGCPYATANQIQIKHLLNHTAGLGDYRRHEDYKALSDTAQDIPEVLPLVFQQEPEFEPGKEWKYSNTGYFLLKAIIEKITGKNFKQVLEQKILNPLGMDDTVLFCKGDLLAQRASGYLYSDDGKHFIRATGEPAPYAGGGLYSTVMDLLAFDQALYSEELLTEESKKIMFTPVKPSRYYGYGWIVVPFGGGRAIYHGGSSDGFNAELRRYPEKRYTIILLSNYHGGSAFELANKIDSMLFDYPYLLATKYDLNFRLGMYSKNRNQDFKKAIEFFEKNLQDLQPHLPSLYESASARLYGKFDQKRAIEMFDLYLKLAGEKARPSKATVWARKGEAYEQLKETKTAIQCYKTSLKLDPKLEWVKKALERLEGK
ncbi:MAG: serine hydrolase [Candidatus Aminicenantes bacterium]|nr:serine hydrolase [Candidatus Aminicenantes bacterium]